MNSRILGPLTVALLMVGGSAEAVMVGDKDWRQLTETTNFTWDQLNSVCGAGLCSGGTGALASLNGWYWADNTEIRTLFEDLIGPYFPTQWTYFKNVGNAQIDAALGPIFTPTYLFGTFEAIQGWSRTVLSNNVPVPWLLNYFDPSAEDSANLTAMSYCMDCSHANIGAWLYRAAPVPEPGTLALLSLGFAGLGLSRRRKAN